MDLRNTEEFKRKHEEMLKKRAAEEVSAKNIIYHLKSAEELRKEVYSENMIGQQGIMYILTGIGIGFSLYTYTSKFKKLYPSAHNFLDRSILTRAIIIILCVRLGIFMEQVNLENNLNPIAFKNYLSAFNSEIML